MTPSIPPQWKRCFPPKTTLIQIKLNEVSVANPSVFQLPKYPPLSPSAPPSLPYEWAGQARCIWPPLHWPCSQAARLPVPDADNSRPRSDFVPRCNCRCAVCVRACACTVNLCCIIPSLTHIVFIPFCLFCTCVCTCAFFKEDLFLFVTCLHILLIHWFRWVCLFLSVCS